MTEFAPDAAPDDIAPDEAAPDETAPDDAAPDTLAAEPPDDDAAAESYRGPSHASLADALAFHAPAWPALELPAAQITQLDDYCRRLWQWNEKLNLTRHTDFERFVARDVVDSVHIAAQIAPGEDVLDVGSGGGVPGILLAILRPDLQVSLCESIGKKAAALDDMVRGLGLAVPVYAMRAESVLADFSFDTLTVRAVGPLWKLCRDFRPYWHTFGRMLVLKGPRWVEERGEARHRGVLANVDLRKVAEYQTPGSHAQNVLLELRRSR